MISHMLYRTQLGSQNKAQHEGLSSD